MLKGLFSLISRRKTQKRLSEKPKWHGVVLSMLWARELHQKIEPQSGDTLVVNN